MKFEKVMKKFCKEIGIDKMTLMTMMLGKNGIEELSSKNEFSSSRGDPFSQQKEKNNFKEGGASTTINTGQAAQLAYNNMV